MNPCLKIIKCEGSKKSTEVRFLVIDLDLSPNYPENFLCVLPRNLSSPNMADCVFMKVFSKPNREAAKEMAKRLLENAFTEYPEFKAEIEKRLTNFVLAP